MRKYIWKYLLCFTCLSISLFFLSCKNSHNFTRKDCGYGSGYRGYFHGYLTGKNSLQRKIVNFNDVYDYCYLQGYIDALG